MAAEQPLTPDHASKAKGLLWLLGAVTLGLCLALGVDPLAHAIPLSWERHLAGALSLGIQAKACKPTPEAEAALKKLEERLYPLDAEEAAQPLEFQVLQDQEVNAYAGLGGRITLNSGLLKKLESAEELAGVLAHEMEHVRHRHLMESLLVRSISFQGLRLVFGNGGASAGWIHFLLSNNFSRAQEAEADKAGLERLRRARVDTQGLMRFFQRMGKEEPGSIFLSDHPDFDSRAEMAKSFSGSPSTPILSPEEWLALKTGFRGEN
jgi:predicted Zn-dependent protease